MNTKALANSSPFSPKASGKEVVSSRPASISTISSKRTCVRSGSSQLVIQHVKIQTHQTARNSSPASIAPRGVRCLSNAWESWVIAKTNTRSKNSSMKVTRWWSCPVRVLCRSTRDPNMPLYPKP